ncbi:MAG TPA: hypothetical protein V6C71_21475 [Coleofasciculaceae cyanobacterium]
MQPTVLADCQKNSDQIKLLIKKSLPTVIADSGLKSLRLKIALWAIAILESD